MEGSFFKGEGAGREGGEEEEEEEVEEEDSGEESRQMGGMRTLVLFGEEEGS